MNTGLSKRNLWAYPVGSVGRDMAVGMFTGYLLTYVLFTKSLTGAQFASLSVIMMARGYLTLLMIPLWAILLRLPAPVSANSSPGLPLAVC